MAVNLSLRGFILQASYQVESGRPALHLSGRLENGESFLIRERRHRPYFYIRQRDRGRAERLGAPSVSPSEMRASGTREPVAVVQLAHPRDAVSLRHRLQEGGIDTFEADIPWPTRFLLDHGIRGGVEIHGPGLRDPRRSQGHDWFFEDPSLTPCSWEFEPSVLSLDIETDPRARRLLSVALVGCGASEVLLLTTKDLECPPGARPFGSEKELLDGLCRRVAELDPDILTGWNVIDFDLRVLDRMARHQGRHLGLGRGGGALGLRPSPGRGPRLIPFLPGRLVLDGLQLLRGAFINLERQSLDAVAHHFLGKGKRTLGEDGEDHGDAISRRFRDDREAFVEYNLTDARLVLEILDHLGLIELTVERSRLTGLPLDRVSRSIAAFDFLYLLALRSRGLVAPSLQSRRGSSATAGGGHVMKPTPGLFENVLVFDFQSLYPSLIRTFQIDPVGWVRQPLVGEDLIVAPNGAAFRREPGILPQMLDELFPRRQAAKAAGDAITSQAIKILMNSFYGVLGASGCRFHDPALANAITSFGREILLWSKARFESYGYRVLYGDTDSLFVQIPKEVAAPVKVGSELAQRLNKDLRRHLRERWGVESRLTLQLERLFLKLFLPPLRGSSGGARKRYAGLVKEDRGPRVVFVGLEAVRTDWTDLARSVQRELYRCLFLDEPIEEYLRRVVKELRRGEHDDALVYRKALRKPLGAYTSTSPPHVVAARRMAGKPGRRIAYFMTLQGPQPARESSIPLDYEHYVDKQILPIAEPVLGVLGLDFRKLIGDDRQLELF